MSYTLEELNNQIRNFNESTKYLDTCDYCGKSIIYNSNEFHDNILKCPYCGHVQKILVKNKFNIILNTKTDENSFDSDSYKVL